MIVATFNINGVNRRLAGLRQWLAERRPDVVCLQEIKCANRDFPASALEESGYGAIWCGQGPHHGVAILARDAVPIETCRRLPGEPGDDEARYLEAAVSGVLVGCLYAPNGNPQPGPKFEYKLRWLGRLIARATELAATGAPIILAGDYNVVPTDRDIYALRSWKKNALVQPEPRALYERLLALGWTDALATLQPDAPPYSFWHYLREAWPRDAGMRLDHLVLSAAARERLVAGDVDREVRGRPNASDHAPAWIELA